MKPKLTYNSKYDIDITNKLSAPRTNMAKTLIWVKTFSPTILDKQVSHI